MEKCAHCNEDNISLAWYVIEWIPFDRLSEVKEIGKGGFDSDIQQSEWMAYEKLKMVMMNNVSRSFLEDQGIACDLYRVHDADAGFHSGNILH
ncbi:hypothetical protein C2G38_2191508 [Gigaspora rosea]|uniref:Uncharacterized protein n=1 Tax=Gigaspora rosea TaxID=44941 RepID=A0A397V1G6_9GLOM|nr:hypothetical protein C2G38_2191508 [Gigaspora rosea]